MGLRDTHRALLERFRHTMNLVGPGPVEVHFEDCDAALEGLDPTGHWADLGTGAGFPGLVLADRFPQVALDLVDSRRKRCVFLEQVVAEAGASWVRVRHTRIEDLEDGIYDGITARALAPPEQVLRHADRLLRPGGRLLLMLQEHQQAPSSPAFEEVHTTSYLLDGKARKAVVLKKTARPGDASPATSRPR